MRDIKKLISYLKAWEAELDHESDLYFAERPFLETEEERKETLERIKNYNSKPCPDYMADKASSLAEQILYDTQKIKTTSND